jgi:Zn-dependent protease/CBS domain-containing protein
MKATWRLGHVRGVPVGLHWSVLLLVGMLANVLASTALPAAAPGAAAGAYWAAGLVGAVLLAGGVLVHELAHVQVARQRGLPVSSITLWALGGVSEFGAEAPDADTELRTALAGPVASAALGAVLGSLAWAFSLAGVADLVVATLSWAAVTNVVLAVFNLLPGSPLDGGRVLRAVLWRRSGDRDAASVTASGAGRWLGGALAGLGFCQMLATGTAAGLWLVLVGWFMAGSAERESRARQTMAGLGERRVGEVMTSNPAVVAESSTLAAFIEETVLHLPYASYPVVDSAGRPVGVLGLSSVAAVQPGRRSELTVAQVCDSLARCVVADETEPLTTLVPRVGRLRADDLVLVVRAGLLVGVISARDLGRLTRRAALLGGAGGGLVGHDESGRRP